MRHPRFGTTTTTAGRQLYRFGYSAVASALLFPALAAYPEARLADPHGRVALSSSGWWAAFAAARLRQRWRRCGRVRPRAGRGQRPELPSELPAGNSADATFKVKVKWWEPKPPNGKYTDGGVALQRACLVADSTHRRIRRSIIVIRHASPADQPLIES